MHNIQEKLNVQDHQAQHNQRANRTNQQLNYSATKRRNSCEAQQQCSYDSNSYTDDEEEEREQQSHHIQRSSESGPQDYEGSDPSQHCEQQYCYSRSHDDYQQYINSSQHEYISSSVNSTHNQYGNRSTNSSAGSETWHWTRSFLKVLITIRNPQFIIIVNEHDEVWKSAFFSSVMCSTIHFWSQLRASSNHLNTSIV